MSGHVCGCPTGYWIEEDPRLDFESATGVVRAKKKFEERLLRWTGDNFTEMYNFCRSPDLKAGYSDFGIGADLDYRVYDRLHDSFIKVNLGDWVAEGSAGEHYPIAHAILISDYERVA